MTRLYLKIRLLVFISFCLSGCYSESNAPAAVPDDCISGFTGSSLDVVTWNLHDFPSNGVPTIDSLANMVTRLDADIIALQEITGTESFNKLLLKLPGYRGIINANADLNLAFLIRDYITIEPESIRILFEDDNYIFPRPPFCLAVSLQGMPDLLLIDIHLKCCEGAENIYRRAMALDKLKQYIDDSLKNERVIILGDFNQPLLTVESENPFSGFLDDSLHYRFADKSVANGDERYWSYPAWPSHIDHIMITDELFDNDISVRCLTPDLCDSLYFVNISDHRPLLMRIR